MPPDIFHAAPHPLLNPAPACKSPALTNCSKSARLAADVAALVAKTLNSQDFPVPGDLPLILLENKVIRPLS
jgi:hypothetical protein